MPLCVSYVRSAHNHGVVAVSVRYEGLGEQHNECKIRPIEFVGQISVDCFISDETAHSSGDEQPVVISRNAGRRGHLCCPDTLTSCDIDGMKVVPARNVHSSIRHGRRPKITVSLVYPLRDSTTLTGVDCDNTPQTETVV